MSNLPNLQDVVIEMMSYSHQVTQTKHKNRQSFCEKCLIDEHF